MEFGHAKGIHVVVLMFAALLLAVPTSDFIASLLWADSEIRASIGRVLPYLAAGITILIIPSLRRLVRQRLSIRIPLDRKGETAWVLALTVAHAFAWLGAYVVWWHYLDGPIALEQRLAHAGTHAQALQEAFSVEGLVGGVLLAGMLGPVIEELVFRGLLYPLWEERFGWFASLLMTCALFGLYHANFLPAFVASVIYTCLYRRTGSLRAPILVHCLYNLSTTYPLLGQFIFPRDLASPGDPASWKLQIATLFVVCIAVPAYVWMARTPQQSSGVLDEHAALPR